jgi:chromosome segregation ATPase
MTDDENLRQRITRQSEDAIGKVAQELLENPVFTGALTRAFEAREKAVQAQTAAMGALNLPSASDLERLTRRLRSVSQRLEGIEDAVERLDDRLAAASKRADSGDTERLERIEKAISELSDQVGELKAAVTADEEPVSRNQERMKVPSE